jgi:hypothetical protein
MDKNKKQIISSLNEEDFYPYFISLLDKSLNTSENTYNIVPTHVRKNNGIIYEGVSISRKNSSTGSNIYPNIYLKDFYREYSDGCSIDSLISEFLCIYKKESDKIEHEMPDIHDFKPESSHDRIILRLINTSRNKKMLSERPHIKIKDLSVIFDYLYMDNGHTIGTIPINSSLYDKSGFSDINELYKQALLNSVRLFPAKIDTMENTIKTMLNNNNNLVPDPDALISEIENDEKSNNPSFYVVTNSNGINGASVLLYPGILDNFEESSKEIIIIPSSIHEILLLPVSKKELDSHFDDITGMLRDVNRTSVTKEEFLSDNLLIYSDIKDEIAALNAYEPQITDSRASSENSIYPWKKSGHSEIHEKIICPV